MSANDGATENTPVELFDFTVSGLVRVIKFIKSEQIEPGFTADHYAFIDDIAHELVIFTLGTGQRTPVKTIHPGRTTLQGFVKGKGTLTVTTAGGTKSTYYYENEGLNKEVAALEGDTVQWIAPNDANLVFFEVRDAAPMAAPVPTPTTPGTKPEANKPIKKLLLTSSPITPEQCEVLNRLTGKHPKSTTVVLILNAADRETEHRAWMDVDKNVFAQLGYKLRIIDLRQYQRDMVTLFEVLKDADVIWIGGGNVFYLRWALKASRADEIIAKLIEKGTVYGGDSAGAMVAGPTLEHFDMVDSTMLAPQIITDGLRIIDTVVVPHINDQANAKNLVAIVNKLRAQDYAISTLKDGQALAVIGDTQQVF